MGKIIRYVYLIYGKDGYGGQEVYKAFGDEVSAINYVMDRDDYLLKNGWNEERLRKYARGHVHKMEVEDY